MKENYILIDQSEIEALNGIVQVHQTIRRGEVRTKETAGKTPFNNQLRTQLVCIPSKYSDYQIRKKLCKEKGYNKTIGGNSNEFIDLKKSNKSIYDLINDIENINQNKDDIKRKSLILRPYQKEAINKMKSFIWKIFGIFMLARKGKTITTLSAIKEIWETNNKPITKVLCLSSRIEVKDAFIDDINEFEELYQSYNICNGEYYFEKESINKNKINIETATFQWFLKRGKNLNKDINYILIDESDFGGNTKKLQKILNLFKDSKIIYITGTPGKLYEDGLFFPESENQYVLDEFDEKNNPNEFPRNIHTKLNRLSININNYVNNPERFHKNFEFSFSAFLENENETFTYAEDVRNFMFWLLLQKQSGSRKSTISSPLEKLLINDNEKALHTMILLDTKAQCEAMRKILSVDNSLFIKVINGDTDELNANQIDNYCKFARADKQRFILISCGMKIRSVTFNDIDITISMVGGSSFSRQEQFARRCCNPNITKTKMQSWYIDLCPERIYYSTIQKIQDHKYSHNLKDSIETLLKKYNVCDDLLEYSNGEFKKTSNDEILNYYKNKYNFVDNIFQSSFYLINFNNIPKFRNKISKKNTKKFGIDGNVRKPKNINSRSSNNNYRSEKQNDSIETLRKALPFIIFIKNIKDSDALINFINTNDEWLQEYFDTEDSFNGLFNDIDKIIFNKEIDSLWIDWFPKNAKDERNKLWSFMNDEINPFFNFDNYITIKYNTNDTILCLRSISGIPFNSNKITFMTNILEEKLLVEKYYDKVNIIYTKEILKSLEEIFNKVNFTKCIMNPPYGNSYLKILKKMTETIVDQNNGTIVSLQPARWIQDLLGYVKTTNDITIFGKRKLFKEAFLILRKDAEKLFNIPFTYDLMISTINNKGNFTTDDIQKQFVGFGYNLYYNHLDIFSKNNIIKYSNQKYFVPLRTTSPTNRPNARYNIFSSYLQYLINGKTPEGKTIKKAIDDNPRITHNVGTIYGIEFNTKNEMINYYNSIQTIAYKYLVSLIVVNNNIKNEFKWMPYMQDYTKPWTSERFYEYFKLTDDEIQIIEDWAKENGIQDC